MSAFERFIRYAKVNTRSDESSQTTPSTQAQVDFAQDLITELKEIGVSEVRYNETNGFVIAKLPASEPGHKAIGFIAHMDTADYNSENVNPQIVENYDGGVIALGGSGFVLDPAEFPNLKNYVGQTLVTTDGTTLLGADDKGGIAAIMTAIEFLIAHPEVKHGDVYIGFGPDEEIGVGADKFDVNDFPVEFAYTVDGGPLGELEWESFNAAAASITFTGKSVHPGSAKDVMVNALQLAVEFHNALPADERPENTEGREGFFMLQAINGDLASAKSQYIIRDHDRAKFEERKATIQKIADTFNGRAIVEISDSYYNMGEVISKDMTPIEVAQQAMEELGIKPAIHPIRGGTDGSKITFMGIPTPNLFAGGENFHGQFEFLSVETLNKVVEVILGIIKNV